MLAVPRSFLTTNAMSIEMPITVEEITCDMSWHHWTWLNYLCSFAAAVPLMQFPFTIKHSTAIYTAAIIKTKYRIAVNVCGELKFAVLTGIRKH